MFKLPIMLGCYDKADKCSVFAKDEKYGGYSLIICRLKKEMNYGDEVPIDNCGKVIAHLHFCKLDAARSFKNCVDALVETWEKELEKKNNGKYE